MVNVQRPEVKKVWDGKIILESISKSLSFKSIFKGFMSSRFKQACGCTWNYKPLPSYCKHTHTHTPAPSIMIRTEGVLAVTECSLIHVQPQAGFDQDDTVPLILMDSDLVQEWQSLQATYLIVDNSYQLKYNLNLGNFLFFPPLDCCNHKSWCWRV